MKDPVISVSRASRQIAVFDDLDLVFPFEPYTDEATAISVARSRIAQRTSKEPRVVFPVIRSMQITTSVSRARLREELNRGPLGRAKRPARSAQEIAESTKL